MKKRGNQRKFWPAGIFAIAFGALALAVLELLRYDPIPKSTEIAKAVERYKQDNGHPPDKLSDLRPDYYVGSFRLGVFAFDRLLYQRHGELFSLEIESLGDTGYYYTNEAPGGWGFND